MVEHIDAYISIDIEPNQVHGVSSTFMNFFVSGIFEHIWINSRPSVKTHIQPSQCAPLLLVSPILNMPGVSSLQSVDFKGHTQGMTQTVSMIGNILGVNTASSTELKNWLRGDGISMTPSEIALPTNVMTTP